MAPLLMETRLTLYELNGRVRDLIKGTFETPLWVVAEINEINTNSSGHCYLELVEKDKTSQHIVARARATIWSSTFRILKPYFETTTGRSLSPGIKVLIFAQVEFHEMYGYSLNIKDIDPNYTLGDMARQRQETIKRLEEEGVFHMNRELVFPMLPSRVALISSRTAAGYEDFLDQLNNNSFGYHFDVTLFPAKMQGQQAVSSIIKALDMIYQDETIFDLVILVRGGGSQTDLSIFDDYSLASHIAQFPLPVLTGIGHEKDESVSDLVAFKSLKTPTAVAEFLLDQYIMLEQRTRELAGEIVLSIQDYLELKDTYLEKMHLKLIPGIRKMLYHSTIKLNNLQTGFKPAIQRHMHSQLRVVDRYSNIFRFSTRDYINRHRQQLFDFYKSMRSQAFLMLHDHKHGLIVYEKTRQLLDPRAVLKRGYSISYQDGKAIHNAVQLDRNKTLKTVYSSGYSISTIDKIRSDNT